MASVINASTSSGLVQQADTSGVLQLQTASTTAIAIDASQNVTLNNVIPSSSTAPTNGMFLPTTNTVGLSTASTERMRIDSSGNVGIGTTATSNGRLTVNGNIIPSGAPSTYWGIDYAPVDATGNSFVTLAYGATYDLAAGSGIVFIFENSSYVGVLTAQCAYGSVYIISNPQSAYTTTVNTASKVNLYYNAGTGKYRIQNNYNVGVSYNFWVATMRIRATT